MKGLDRYLLLLFIFLILIFFFDFLKLRPSIVGYDIISFTEGPSGGTNRPRFQTGIAVVADPSQYAPGKDYSVELRWQNITGNISFVILEANFTGTLQNYTRDWTQAVGPIGSLNTLASPGTSNGTGEYWKNFTQEDFPGTGDYQYRWISNSTTGGFNSTNSVTFTVVKNTSTSQNINLTFNGTEGAATLTYPAVVNASGTNNSQAFSGQTISFTLMRNSTVIGSGGVSEIIRLLVGDYNYTYNTSGNLNYSIAFKNFTLRIGKGQISVSLFLNSTQNSNKTYTYPQAINSTGSKSTTVESQYNISLFRDGRIVSSSTSGDLTQENIFLVPGTYNYTVLFNGSSNYTDVVTTFYATVSKGIPSISLTVSPSFTVSEGTSVTVTCSVSSLNNEVTSLTLTRDGQTVSNPHTTTPAAGSYLYQCNTGSTQNYSASSSSNTLQVGGGGGGGGGGGSGGNNTNETDPTTSPSEQNPTPSPGTTINLPQGGISIVLEPKKAFINLYPNSTDKTGKIESIEKIDPNIYAKVKCDQDVLLAYKIELSAPKAYFCGNYSDVKNESITAFTVFKFDKSWIESQNISRNDRTKIVCGRISSTPYMIAGILSTPTSRQALDTISITNSSIVEAYSLGLNVSSALDPFTQAIEAYNNCQYKDAIDLSQRATGLIPLGIPTTIEKLAPYINAAIIAAIMIVAAALYYYHELKKRVQPGKLARKK